MIVELDYSDVRKARKRILIGERVDWEEYASFYKKLNTCQNGEMRDRALRIVGMDLVLAGVVGVKKGYEFHTDKGVISLPVTLPNISNRFARESDALNFGKVMKLEGVVVPIGF